MTPCIEYMKFRNKDGYGIQSVKFPNGKWRAIGAHRVSYCRANNLPYDAIDGLVIMHSCDNPACVNPEHLSVGTQTENVADMYAKGRSYDKSGAGNPRAKVSPEDVRYIRANYIKGHKEFGGAALGRRFGLAKTTVFHIINATSWVTV